MERRPSLNGSDESEISTSTVNIKEYFYLFWSWAWLILLAGLVAGGTAYFFSRRTTPIYQSSTRLLVSAPPALSGIDTGAMITSQMMTSTYAKMLVDRPVLQGVIDQLKLPTTPDDLKESISVDIVLNTQLLVVTVKDPNPARAADIGNAIGSVFATRIREFQSQRYAASRSGLEKQVSDMEQQITETSNAIAAETDPGLLTQFQARLTQYRTIYSNLVISYEQMRLAEAQTSTNVIVTEPATPSQVPISPKTMLNTLLALVSGMLLAVGMVFMVDALDDTLKNPDEIRKKFDLPILGVITRHEMKDEKPISSYKPRSPVAEALRSLRTNITYAAVDTPLTRILITSATSQEGKTSIAANLAVVLAQGEKKVLLMDADLRRPMVHRKFGLHNQVGLSDLFLPNPPAEVIQPSEVANLSIITSGTAATQPGGDADIEENDPNPGSYEKGIRPDPGGYPAGAAGDGCNRPGLRDGWGDPGSQTGHNQNKRFPADARAATSRGCTSAGGGVERGQPGQPFVWVLLQPLLLEVFGLPRRK